MNAAFADTSFYIAFANPRDRWHTAAIAWASRWRGILITTDYVFLELGNHLSDPVDRPLFMRLIAIIKHDNKTRVIPASPELLQAGVTLFGNRPDKRWSLTDCISFVVMGSKGITNSFTSDRHFEQAGFRIPLTQ